MAPPAGGGPEPLRPALVPAGLLVSPLAAVMWVAHALVRRPSVLAAGTLLLACLPSGAAPGASVTVTAADLGAVALVGALALNVLGGARPLSHRAWIPFAFVLVALAAATVASADPQASLPGFVRYVQLFVLLPVAVAAAVRDRKDVVLVAGAAVGVAVIEGGVGTWQFLTGTGASFGLENVRAVGTFGAADVMGMSQVVGYGIVVALAAGLALRGPGRFVMLCLAGLLCLPLAFSLSRGSWIATCAGVAAVVLTAGWRLAVKAALGLAALATVLVGGLGVGSGLLAARLSSITAGPDQSVSDRYGLWQAALGMWGDHPLTGVGLRNFPLFRDSYAPLSVSSGSDVADAVIGFQREPLLSPHNMYLLILGEQGLLGISAFGILFLALLTAALRRRGRFVWPSTAANRLVDLAAPGIVLWTFTNFLYGDIGGPSSVSMAVLLGLVARRGFVADVPTHRPAPPPPQPPPILVESTPPTPSRTLTQPRSAGERRRKRDVLASAALVSAVLAVLGMLLGLTRDLLLAAYYGADGGTDAFLVAWTVPETAAPLLIEGALAYLMVPLVSRALGRGESLRTAVAATLPRIATLLVVAAAATYAAAPLLVRALAPGIADPALAVTSLRWVSVTVVMFGLAGYLSSTLRATRSFVVPAGIYLAYNVGIVGAMVALHQRSGITAAAMGVAAGSVLMVLVQLPSFLRRLRAAPRRDRAAARLTARSAVTLAAVAPLATFTLTRQAQVFIERYLGSSLPEGTISHLNYAQKVGQVPMTLALVLTTVTFPALARAMASGDGADTRRRVESDLRMVAVFVLLAGAYVVAFAPSIVRILFEHGLYTAQDTAATSTILRVYVLGLLGHAYVGVLSRPYFSAARPTWYPAAAMGIGLLANAVLAVVLSARWGAAGIAGANAAGICLAAVLLVHRAPRCVPGLSRSAVGTGVLWLLLPTEVATVAGLLLVIAVPQWPDLAVLAAGGVAVTAVFGVVLALTDRPVFRQIAGLVRPRRTDAR